MQVLFFLSQLAVTGHGEKTAHRNAIVHSQILWSVKKYKGLAYVHPIMKAHLVKEYLIDAHYTLHADQTLIALTWSLILIANVIKDTRTILITLIFVKVTGPRKLLNKVNNLKRQKKKKKQYRFT